MLIVIEKDGATRVPKEVASVDEAKGFAEAGFAVFVVVDGVETPLASYDQPSDEVTGEGDSKPSDGLTVAELKEALDAKGIEYDPKAKKVDLAALLDAAA